MIEKILYIAALLSIFLSVWIYQTNQTLGTFIGLWVPTLLLIGRNCPWGKDNNGWYS